MNAQEKYEIKLKLKKMRHATRAKGEKWGNKEMAAGRNFILSTKPKPQENWKGETKTEKIGDLLKLWI